jgi:hypothetical protein
VDKMATEQSLPSKYLGVFFSNHNLANRLTSIFPTSSTMGPLEAVVPNDSPHFSVQVTKKLQRVLLRAHVHEKGTLLPKDGPTHIASHYFTIALPRNRVVLCSFITALFKII